MGFMMLKKLELSKKKSSVHFDLHINLELAILKLISSKSKGSNLIILNPIPSITEGRYIEKYYDQKTHHPVAPIDVFEIDAAVGVSFGGDGVISWEV